MRTKLRMVSLVLALICVPVTLTGCAPPGTRVNSAGQTVTLTPAQNLYQAHGYYNIALEAAVTYAESPVASAPVVRRLTEANRLIRPTIIYAEAVVACAGPTQTSDLVIIAANARCSGLDLSPENVVRQANVLRTAASRLFGFLQGGG